VKVKAAMLKKRRRLKFFSDAIMFRFYLIVYPSAVLFASGITKVAAGLCDEN